MFPFTIIYQRWDSTAKDYAYPEITIRQFPSVADVYAWAEDNKFTLVAVFEGRLDNLVEE